MLKPFDLESIVKAILAGYAADIEAAGKITDAKERADRIDMLNKSQQKIIEFYESTKTRARYILALGIHGDFYLPLAFLKEKLPKLELGAEGRIGFIFALQDYKIAYGLNVMVGGEATIKPQHVASFGPGISVYLPVSFAEYKVEDLGGAYGGLKIRKARGWSDSDTIALARHQSLYKWTGKGHVLMTSFSFDFLKEKKETQPLQPGVGVYYNHIFPWENANSKKIPNMRVPEGSAPGFYKSKNLS